MTSNIQNNQQDNPKLQADGRPQNQTAPQQAKPGANPQERPEQNQPKHARPDDEEKDDKDGSSSTEKNAAAKY